MRLRSVIPALKQTFASWDSHDAPRLGAAIAFYSILSLAPLMIFVVSICGLVFGSPVATDDILAQVRSTFGVEGAKEIEAILAQAHRPAAGIIASVIAFLTLLFGASGVFGELRSALNQIWDVAPGSGSGIWNFFRQRIFSIGMVLAIGFLLLVSLVVSTGMEAVGKYGGQVAPHFLLGTLDAVVSLAGITLLFALIFKYVPDRHIGWRDVWQGAFATAVLFTIGKYLIGLYLGRAAVGSAYGAAGSLVVIVVWIYYSSMIFLFGAELTRVLQAKHEESPKAKTATAYFAQ